MSALTKIIHHNAGRIDLPDDPDFGPWKFEATLAPPGFMTMAFVCAFGGTETLVVRGKTKEALEEVIERCSFRGHPRLHRLIITGPDDYREEIITITFVPVESNS